MLGTLSAAEAPVKRFGKFHFPPNVDNRVETMCTVGCCFVDQTHDRITARWGRVETSCRSGLM